MLKEKISRREFLKFSLDSWIYSVFILNSPVTSGYYGDQRINKLKEQYKLDKKFELDYDTSMHTLKVIPFFFINCRRAYVAIEDSISELELNLSVKLIKLKKECKEDHTTIDERFGDHSNHYKWDGYNYYLTDSNPKTDKSFSTDKQDVFTEMKNFIFNPKSKINSFFNRIDFSLNVSEEKIKKDYIKYSANIKELNLPIHTIDAYCILADSFIIPERIVLKGIYKGIIPFDVNCRLKEKEK